MRSDPSVTAPWVHQQLVNLLVENVLFLHAAEVTFLDKLFDLSVLREKKGDTCVASCSKNA